MPHEITTRPGPDVLGRIIMQRHAAALLCGAVPDVPIGSIRARRRGSARSRPLIGVSGCTQPDGRRLGLRRCSLLGASRLQGQQRLRPADEGQVDQQRERYARGEQAHREMGRRSQGGHLLYVGSVMLSVWSLTEQSGAAAVVTNGAFIARGCPVRAAHGVR